MKFRSYANSGIFALVLFDMLINLYCPNQINKNKQTKKTAFLHGHHTKCFFQERCLSLCSFPPPCGCVSLTE